MLVDDTVMMVEGMAIMVDARGFMAVATVDKVGGMAGTEVNTEVDSQKTISEEPISGRRVGRRICQEWRM